MLTDIVHFEWRYHTRQVSFLAAAALFFIFGFALTTTGFGPDNVNVNSPYSIAQSIGLLSLAAVFILAVFCANAVVRDRETQMEEIVFTTSVAKLPFLVGRFTGSFLAAFTAFSASALGMLIARFMPWLDPDRLGAVNPLHYLWALLVIALPNMLFAGVVLFALSTITRSVLASYVGSVLLYVLYFVTAAMTNSPLMASSVPGVNEGASLAALLDPFALSAFFEQTQNWVPAVRNTRLLSLTGNLLLNRLLWIAASIAILALVYRLFSFRVAAGARQPARAAHEHAKAVAAATALQTIPYTPVPTEPSQWASYLAATKIEIRTFLLTLPFFVMLLLWAALAAFEIISDVNGGEYGSASYPASGMLFSTIHTPLTMLATILLIYTAAEMVWRERTLRISGILHATPAANAVFVASKCTALTALIVALTATALGTAAVVQLAKDWSPDPMLLLSFGYFIAAPLVLFACAAVFIQTLSPHKYVGMLIVVLLAVISMQGEAFGLEQRLLRFGSVPSLIYSEMNGFGPSARFHWFIAYWSALAGLFLLLATALWRHGVGGLRRLRPILRRASRSSRAVAIALTAAFIATGAVIFYNTNVLNAHETQAEVLDWKAGYERTYKTFAALPQPRIAEVRASVDLYPVERRFRVRGEYGLVNETARPIDRILLAVRRDADAVTLKIPAARQSVDQRFHQHLFRLDTPLQPGARTAVHFDVTYENPGFVTDDVNQTVIENGSYVMTHRAFPSIGYRASYEIEDPRERRRQGLPVSSAAAAASREFLQHDEIAAMDWVRFDVTVSTAGDQQVVAPGRLVRQWEHDGRRSFQFRPDAPIPNQFIIASARYAVTKATHHGVPIEIYHHPGHTYNVARMMRAAADSLAYLGGNFGPYRHDTLRLAEVSAHFANFSGFAQPGVVFFGENRGFLIDARDPRRLDLVYRRVAHEIAHQWFGYTLVPADGPGDSMLTESLTKYCELMVLEKAYGREQVRQSLTYELDLYLSGRTGESEAEPPLSRVDNQAYLYYRKGALVLYALKDLLGEATVNTALRNLMREMGGPRKQSTSAHVLRHLLAVAPPQHHALIDQWLNGVVLYDFKLDKAASRRLPNGKYEVTMRVTAAKESHDQPIAMGEAIDIGVFSAEDERLYLAKHTLRDGAQDITVVVDKAPLIAAVDPYICRIDRNRFDNSKRIE
jgi:ABC-2 type transport system permease protein